MVRFNLDDPELIHWKDNLRSLPTVEAIFVRNVNELMVDLNCSFDEVVAIKRILSKQYLAKCGSPISSWKVIIYCIQFMLINVFARI